MIEVYNGLMDSSVVKESVDIDKSIKYQISLKGGELLIVDGNQLLNTVEDFSGHYAKIFEVSGRAL